MRRFLCILTLAAVAAIPPGIGRAETAGPRVPGVGSPVAGAAAVVTGDRIVVNGSSIWLWGVDAPDEGQLCLSAKRRAYDCAAIATAKLEAMVAGREVVCDVSYTTFDGDRSGRCFVDGIDLGEMMVLSGWAFAYRRISPIYNGHEAWAQSRGMGMWTGTAEPPWLFRDRIHRDPAASGMPTAYDRR